MTSKPKILITYNGETHNQHEWAEITGLSYSLINSRRKNGCNPELILYRGKLVDFHHNEQPRNEWNWSSAECYKRGCQCSGCYIMPDDLKIQCRMKYSVRELVKKYGAPKREFI